MEDQTVTQTKRTIVDMTITTGKFAKTEVTLSGEVEEVLNIDLERINTKMLDLKEKARGWEI